MTLTPLFAVGIPLAIAGAVTSVSTSFAQTALEYVQHNEFQTALTEDEERRKIFLISLDTAFRFTKAASIPNQAVKLHKLSKFSGVGVRGAVNLSKGVKVFAGFGIAFSAIDLVSTWTSNPPTLNDMDKVISKLE